jgi:hypothetical protein
MFAGVINTREHILAPHFTLLYSKLVFMLMQIQLKAIPLHLGA